MSIKLSIDSLSTAIILLDQAYNIEFLNPSAEQLLGFSNKQLREETFFDLIKSTINPTLLQRYLTGSQSSPNNLPVNQVTLLEEIEIKTATGILITNIMVSGYYENQQNYLLLELQSNEYHSRIRKDIELQHQSRVSNHLIRNLAHEIKNPLGGIKGSAQLMARKLPADFPARYCEIIIQEANRLGKLVDRLLLPSTPEEKVSINTHQLIEQALELILLQTDKSINVIKNYDPSLPDLTLSPGQIQQALLNLLKNAAEALADQGKIEIRTRILHQHTIGKIQYRQVIRIDIIDNGTGIPDELINDIFFPTISGKNSSGLGLSIAQSLVQRHGGIIELETWPEHTCFSIYLPLESGIH
ncbi:nitrogen regulation protein NR(II) [Aliikangiella maris]|uniref:Nitrogen regulation protein NR(II) n=2 Tax=Aliikangiella maris TaxID=3162458 RepID=A0ABV2BXZ6_9GAMM